MNEDRDIKQLFDDYGDMLVEDKKLTQKAVEQMERNGRRGGIRNFSRALGIVCGLAVSVVLVVMVGFNFPKDGDGNGQAGAPGMSDDSVNEFTPSSSNEEPENPGDPSQAPGQTGDNSQDYTTDAMPHSFTPSDVVGRSVEQKSIEKMLSLENLKRVYGDSLVGERYFAYYFKGTNHIAFVSATFAIRTGYSLTEVNIIALPMGSTYSKYEELRGELSRLYYEEGNKTVNISTRNNGEYVTNSYLERFGYYYLIIAQGSEDNGKNIAKNF